MRIAGISTESLAQPPVQLVVGDADEAFREAAAALGPLANVTIVRAPPNAGDSAFVHSALCYAHALELCSQHARCFLYGNARSGLARDWCATRQELLGQGSDEGTAQGQHQRQLRDTTQVLRGRHHNCWLENHLIETVAVLRRYVLVVEDDVAAAPGYLGRLSGAIAAAESLQVSF